MVITLGRVSGVQPTAVAWVIFCVGETWRWGGLEGHLLLNGSLANFSSKGHFYHHAMLHFLNCIDKHLKRKKTLLYRILYVKELGEFQRYICSHYR